MQRVIKDFFKISFHSTILFCVVSFISLVVSMLKNKIEGTFPNFSMGFPFKFYSQFVLKGNDFHHGAEAGLIPDFLITWLLVFLYFKLKNKRKQTHNE